MSEIMRKVCEFAEESRDKKDDYSLIEAVKDGRLYCVRQKIKSDIDINITQNGRTALTIAAREGFHEIVWEIFKNRDVETITLFNEAFSLAVKSGQVNTIRLFMEYGADVNYIVDEIPIVLKNIRNVQVLMLLINSGANIKLHGDYLLDTYLSLGFIEAVKVILQYGVKFNPKSQKIENSFLYQIKSSSVRDMDKIKFYVENGVDINCKDEDGNTPLILVANPNNYEITKYLLEKGADANCEDNYGNTVFHKAIEYSHIEPKHIELYKKYGVNMDVINENGNTPLMFACCNKKNLLNMKCLINNGADVNAIDNNDKTPLYYAINNREIEKVELLLENGADINFTNKNNCSLLMRKYDNDALFPTDILKLLLEKGINIDIKDKYGNTALNYAFIKGDTKCFSILEEYQESNKKESNKKIGAISKCLNIDDREKITEINSEILEFLDINSDDDYDNLVLVTREVRKDENNIIDLMNSVNRLSNDCHNEGARKLFYIIPLPDTYGYYEVSFRSHYGGKGVEFKLTINNNTINTTKISVFNPSPSTGKREVHISSLVSEFKYDTYLQKLKEEQESK